MQILILFFVCAILAKDYSISILTDVISPEQTETFKTKIKERLKNLNHSHNYKFDIYFFDDTDKCNLINNLNFSEIVNEIDDLYVISDYDFSKKYCLKYLFEKPRKTENVGIINVFHSLNFLDKFFYDASLRRNYELEFICLSKSCETSHVYSNVQIQSETLLDLSQIVIGKDNVPCEHNEKYPNKSSNEIIDYQCHENLKVSTFFRCSSLGTWPFAICQCDTKQLIPFGVTHENPCPHTAIRKICRTVCNENLYSLDNVVEFLCDQNTFKWLPNANDCFCKLEQIDHVEYDSCEKTAIGSKCKYTCKNDSPRKEREITCTPEGWDIPPRCECAELPEIPRALFDSACKGAKVGVVCAVKCEFGYKFVGNDPVCGRDGKWAIKESNCILNQELSFSELFEVEMDQKTCIKNCMKEFKRIIGKGVCSYESGIDKSVGDEDDEGEFDEEVQEKYMPVICNLNCCH